MFKLIKKFIYFYFRNRESQRRVMASKDHSTPSDEEDDNPQNRKGPDDTQKNPDDTQDPDNASAVAPKHTGPGKGKIVGKGKGKQLSR